MTRRSDKTQAEPFEIVEGVAKSMDLELAGIARACVYVTDRQAAAQLEVCCLVDVRSERGEIRIVGRRCRLGKRRLQQAFEEDFSHCFA